MTQTNPLFTLTINGRPYKFKTKTFAKVSKRAGQLIKNGIYEDKIDGQIPSEAVTAFVAACNLQQFKVTATNAFDLLDLAVDYKIANLEKFVNNYVAAKGLVRPESDDVTDYLQVFIDKMNARELTTDDYMNLAQRIDKYITDERMYTINTLPLFRLILYTDYTGIDDIKLNAFVTQLLQQKPETAVPLLLRIDFNKLTRQQENEIFSAYDLHHNNFNFFIASSLSADRNRLERNLNALDKEIEKQANDLDTDMHNLRRDHIDELETTYQNEYGEMKQMADDQKRQIDELRAFLDKTKELIDKLLSDYEDNGQKIRDETERQRQNLEESKRIVEECMNKARDEIEKQTNDLRDKIMQLIHELIENDMNRREEIERKRVNPYESLLRNIARMKKNCATLDDAIQATEEETNLVKATLAAKMVKDFMRFDNFIRRNEKRFKIFDKQEIWGLRSSDVKQAETELSAIERRVDKLCPIRHAVSKKK